MKKNTLILFLIILMILYATKFANATPVCEGNVCTYTYDSGFCSEPPCEDTITLTLKDGVTPPESVGGISGDEYVYRVDHFESGATKTMIVNDGTQNIEISVGGDNNGLRFFSPGTFEIHYNDYGSEDGSIIYGWNEECYNDICSWQYNYDNGVLKSATYTDDDEVERVLETYQWENGKLVVYDANGKRVEGTYDNLKAYLLSQYANENSDPTDILDSDFGTVGYVPSRLKTPPSTDNENSARCIAGQNRKDCRIYTIDEANAVAGERNRVSIKYR